MPAAGAAPAPKGSPPSKPKGKLAPETRPGRSRGWRITLAILKWGTIAGLAFGALAAAGLAAMFWVYSTDPDLPRISTIKDYRPKQVTRIYSADGKVVGELFEERRTFVPIDKIAPIMVQAIIDSEDAEFRTHGGLDFTGMARAVWVDVRSGKRRQGGSTITQQVVKTFFLGPKKTFKRKLQEMILARRLEQALTKDEILTLYLNQIYFGHGRYGVEEASRYFFGKSASALDVGEAALLAGLVQSPEMLSPLRHPDAAKNRQTYVLGQMAAHGHITQADAKRWIDAPISVIKNGEPDLDQAPEFVEIVKKELVAKYGENELPYLGLTVRTTLDLGLEQQARAAVESGLVTLDGRHGYRGAMEKIPADKVAAREKLLAKELDGGAPKLGETYDAIVVSVDDSTNEMVMDLGGWKGLAILHGDGDDRYNPVDPATNKRKKPSERFAKNDLVRVRLAPELGAPKSPAQPGVEPKALALELGPQAAMVVIDPANRHVLALVGGYHYGIGGFDRATRAKRQPGSSFKPFVYAAALDGGNMTPATVMNDAPEVYDLWKPQNYEKEEFRGPIRLRTALALSINTVAIRVLHETGFEPVIALAHACGINEELPKDLSLALGSGVVTPVELVNAYTTIATGGQFAQPVFIASIGTEIPPVVPPTQAMRPEVAYVITSMMESVIDEGTGVAAKKLGRPMAGLAGKTGTSNGGRDAWFVGFSPDLVAGVWVGFDDMRKLGRGEAGAKAALPIWVEFMKGALKTRPTRTFRQPPGVVVARIDRASGKLAAPGQAEATTLDEVFLDGTAPKEIAPAPGEADPSTFVIDQLNDEDEATPTGNGKTPAPGAKKAPGDDGRDDPTTPSGARRVKAPTPSPAPAAKPAGH